MGEGLVSYTLYQCLQNKGTKAGRSIIYTKKSSRFAGGPFFLQEVISNNNDITY